MSIIRQESLFDIKDLYEMNQQNRFEAVFSSLDIEPILWVVSKKSIYGRPTELNYTAMIYALVARLMERIPTIKDLIKRLEYDFMFRLDCGFTFSDEIPSEASFSRMSRKFSESEVLVESNDSLVLQAITEGFIQDDTAAIDATDFEARDHATTEDKKPKPEPKKRGRKSKSEKEQWEKEKQELESQMSLYEKPIETQLNASLDDLRREIPIKPNWGIKKNSEGKNKYWFGYKGHLAVGTKSQYILQSLMSSASLNDGKAAIPLLKGIHEKLSLPIR